MKIIVINPEKDFSEEQRGALKAAGEVYFVESAPDYASPIFTDTEEKILAVGPEVTDWSLPNDVLEKIPNIKAVCLPTTSFSWVDGAYLKTKGIPLTNVPKYSTESVAEYAISMMLNIARKIPLLMKNDWKLDYDKHSGWDVKGKAMGIVGLGDIGTRIGEIGQAMGMKVVYWSRNSRNEKFEYRELDDVMRVADFLFPTAAKNKETANLINADKLALMKQGSFVVSITGGEIVDLAKAEVMVKEGHLAGLAFEDEHKKIAEFEGNILVTPPIAWFTKESAAEDIRIWTETIVACVKGSPVNVVN